MNTKKVSIITVFAALTVLINLSPIKIPAPYAPFLIYQLWEIPITTATLLFGFSIGVGISIINTMVLLVIFPGALPTGPFYNLVAILSMLVGVYGIEKLSSGLHFNSKTISVAFFSTSLGSLTRVVTMTIVNWAFLPYPPPVGFSIPAEALPAILPAIAFFNATLALYTIPLGYIFAKAIKNRLSPS